MAKTYEELSNDANRANYELNRAIESRNDSDIICCRGRYIRALQRLSRMEKSMGVNHEITDRTIAFQIDEHKIVLKNANRENRKSSKYSTIKECSLGFKSLVNSIKGAAYADGKDEKIKAAADIAKDVGRNVVNVGKALVVTPLRVLSNKFVSLVVVAIPAVFVTSLDLLFHLEDPKYESKIIDKFTLGFQKAVNTVNKGVKRI